MSMELSRKTEIVPAVQTFSSELASYLDQMGLPSHEILVPYNRRRPVFNNMPDVLDSLTDEQRLKAVYISKFAAACAVGLFDAALNYLWNETIWNLREKVAKFDLEYFFDSVVTDTRRRSKLRVEADLEKLEDWELIRGCHSTGIITENGFRHLDYIRDMRNHASAAHPNQIDITGLQIIGWLETCIVEVLAKQPSGPVIEVRRLLHSLRTEQLTEADVSPIETGLESLPEELSGALLRAVIGMYTDTKLSSQVKDNIQLVAELIWKATSPEVRSEIGLKQATLAANGQKARANLAREFIEIVGGFEFLTDDTRAGEMSTILDDLMMAHHGLNNFHTESVPARLLFRLARKGNLPKAVLKKHVKTVTMCRIGNGYGVSWSGRRYYNKMIARFTEPHILEFVNLVYDPEVASRLRLSSCADAYQALATTLKERAVKPRLKEVLRFIEKCPSGEVSGLKENAKYRRLRRTLRL